MDPAHLPERIGRIPLMKKREEYDWLNDPFDEKKIAEEQEQAKMSGCSRMGILIAVLCIIVIVCVVGFISCSAIMLGA